MKSTIITSTLVAAALAASGIAQAGTTNLSGDYSGSLTFTMHDIVSGSASVLGTNTTNFDFSFDGLGGGTFSMDPTWLLFESNVLTLTGPLTIAEQTPGNYLGSYTLNLGGGSIPTTILWDISLSGSDIIVSTLDGDNDGIVGTQLSQKLFGKDLAPEIYGTVSAVPVPAAVWLFGSGLMGLVGVARRRKARA